MPETTTDTTTTPAKPGGSHLDHLANLHRMSRTAGLGSSEYSAVNVAAVVALLIGVASALSLISWVFLFLPIVGTLLAVVAIKQIASSSGTQTGLPLAVLALVLSFGLTAFTGAKALTAARSADSDVAAIDDLVKQFGQCVADKKFDQAYALTDERFQDAVPKAAFENLWTEIAKAPTLGPVKGMRTNKLFQIDTDPETNLRMAVGYLLIDCEKTTSDLPFRTESRYRNNNGQWKVYAIPQLFAAQKPAAASNQPAGGPAGPPK